MVSPFDSFSEVIKLTTFVGFYKLDQPTKRWKIILYEIYKSFSLFAVLVYDAQYLIYSLHPDHTLNQLAGSLMFSIPMQNVPVKVFNIFFQLSRIERLNEFMKGSIFGGTAEDEIKILQSNEKSMHRLCKSLVNLLSVSIVVLASTTVVKRYVNGEEDVVPMYLPYKNDTVFGFSMLVLNQIVPLIWIGYGHLSIDVLITTYYAQAKTQLKIIKQQLKNLLEDGSHDDKDYLKATFQYKDLTNVGLKQKFVAIVVRYDKLVWYVNEVNSIFNFPITMQFVTSGATICFIIYGMTQVTMMSVPFLFLVLLVFILLTQTYLFCCFGNFIYIESLTINDALYESDWLSLSPSFRRLLLIAMARWSRPLQPTVCGIIKLSLDTFISIVKSSYTLYTVLVTSGNVNNEK